MRHLVRFVAVLVVLAVAVVLLAAGYGRVVLGRSLPRIDGTLTLAGLSSPVTVTLNAGSRVDLARAVGFVHAQERFFQMDLQRRQPAGELAALVGPAAVAADRTMRVHRFRAVARAAAGLAPADYRAELDAYAAGV